MSKFKDKVAVITGGAGGMGIELCSYFIEQGARVVMIDAVAAAVDNGLSAVGHGCSGVTCDVADEGSVNAAFDRIAREHGRIDILVCAAGVRPIAQLMDQGVADWDRCMRINLTGVLLCNRAAARHMLAVKSGSIINIASVNGVRACEGMGAYNVSKAGVSMLTKTLACELASRGVRVNAVLPAQIETPMIAEQVGEERKRREDRIPIGRYGKPHEIATAVGFLASDDASFITGHELAVDGGYLAFGFRPAIYS